MHRTAYTLDTHKPVYAGMINLLDNYIEETVPYKKALGTGFNHSEYFKYPSKLLDDNYAYFYIRKDPKTGKTAVMTDFHNEGKPFDFKKVARQVAKQLELDDTDYYSDKSDVDKYGLDTTKEAEKYIFNEIQKSHGWYDKELPKGRSPYDYKYTKISPNVIESVK